MRIFTFEIMTIQETYIKIEQLRKELDDLRPLKPEDERKIMDKFRLDWNYHSSHIEGNTLTYGETKALLLFGITADGKPFKDHLEIQGHNEAIKWVDDVIKQERPLTENFIRELHELILKKSYEVDAITPDGKPTTKQIRIGEYKRTANHVLTKTGEIFRFAEPEETPAMMTDLLDFYKVHSVSTETNFVWLASVFHYKFIRVHPFDDGNGRMARILMNFILMQHGYPPVIIKSNQKDAYITALQKADVGDLESFVVYIGEQLALSLELMIKGAKGEEIEDSDDLDKKIALLKNKIENINPGGEIKVERSPEAIMSIYTDSLVPLFHTVINQVKKFTDFYSSTLVSLFMDGNATGSDIERRFEEVKIRIQESYIMSNLQLSYNLKGFKKAGTSTMNDFVQVSVGFHEFAYEITASFPSIQPFGFKKLYHQQLSEEEIKTFVNNIGQALYNKVEDNLKKIQNSK